MLRPNHLSAAAVAAQIAEIIAMGPAGSAGGAGKRSATWAAPALSEFYYRPRKMAVDVAGKYMAVTKPGGERVYCKVGSRGGTARWVAGGGLQGG